MKSMCLTSVSNYPRSLVHHSDKIYLNSERCICQPLFFYIWVWKRFSKILFFAGGYMSLAASFKQTDQIRATRALGPRPCVFLTMLLYMALKIIPKGLRDGKVGMVGSNI